MKNLTKIFMAVVAVMLVSCIADTTTEPTVELGKVKTTIDLSFEGVKTHLGDKNGTQYPLLWSAGDQIAVNGIASEPLAEEFDGKAGASFEIESNGELGYPRSIVYPAPAEGETGVTLPAVQAYKAGNIADGVAPLYGYAAEAGDVITLQHLTGVLRFAVKGDATLATMTVKAATGALAGSFDIDCATGVLTAQEGKTSSEISMSFGEGLALTETAQPIYIAVPAGKYGIIEATLTTTDGKKMAVKFDTEAKPITAGKVREFAEFPFSENVIEGDVFEIWDIEDLKTFAQTAVIATWAEAKLMADLDMTGEAWDPVEGFAKIFDGNGKSIKGLSAPMFGTTSAQIKNLTLEGVALVSNGKLIMGSIANTLTSAGQTSKASLTNCKAIGTLTVSNPEWQPIESQQAEVGVANYGGLIGRALGADIIGCTNQVAVTVEQMTIKDNTIRLYPSVAGVVGYVNKTTLADETEAVTTIKSTNNDAAVSYNCVANASNKAMINRPYVGGVVARCEDSSKAVLTDSQNTANGAITLNSSTYGTYNYNGGVIVGGFASRIASATITNCDNYGKVTVDNRHYALLVGGIAGLSYACTSTNCDNFGEVEVKESATLRGVMAGGVFGCDYTSSGGTSYCTNNAKVTIAASTEEGLSVTTKALYYRIGGIIGFSQAKAHDLTNNKGGDVIVSGNVTCTTSAGEDYFAITGVIGLKTGTTLTDNIKNCANVTVNANFKYANDDIAAAQSLHIGGVIGGCSGNPTGTGIVNEGKVTFDGSIEGNGAYLAVAGVVGGSHKYFKITPTKPLLNKGEVIIGENAVIKVPCSVGGVFARNEDARASYERSGLKNEGNITVKGTIEADTHIGGLGGFFNIKCTDGSNSGKITLHENASVTGNLYIGGIAGYSVQTLDITGLKNSGAVTIDGGVTGSVYIGGMYGQTQSPITGANNSGAVTVGNAASISGDLYAGGVMAYYNATTAVSGLRNSGDVSMNGELAYETAHIARIAGVIGYGTSSPLTDVVNTGNIGFAGKLTSTVASNTIYMGGVACNMAGATLTKVTNGEQGKDNKGKISFTGSMPAKSNNNLHVGGVVANLYNAFNLNLTTIRNYGDFEIAEGAVLGYALYYGGITECAVKKECTYEDCINEGDVTINGTINYNAFMGGITYQANTTGTYKNCHNKGSITFGSSSIVKGRPNIGGFAGNITSSPTFDGCSNSGSIVFNGTHTKYGYIRFGGIGGYVSTAATGSITIKNGFTNSGNMSVGGSSGSHADVKQLGLGGLFGSISCPIVAEGEGEIKNTGTISFTGETEKDLSLGGIAGISAVAITVPVINVGNLTCSGKATAATYIGGIVGQSTGGVTGAKSFCEIEAVGYNAGMITGSARSATVIASNCQLGGKIATTESEKKTWDDDTEDYIVAVTPDWNSISNDNYFSYIYGSADWAGVEGYDGCSWLSAAPAVSAQ